MLGNCGLLFVQLALAATILVRSASLVFTMGLVKSLSNRDGLRLIGAMQIWRVQLPDGRTAVDVWGMHTLQ